MWRGVPTQYVRCQTYIAVGLSIGSRRHCPLAFRDNLSSNGRVAWSGCGLWCCRHAGVTISDRARWKLFLGRKTFLEFNFYSTLPSYDPRQTVVDPITRLPRCCSQNGSIKIIVWLQQQLKGLVSALLRGIIWDYSMKDKTDITIDRIIDNNRGIVFMNALNQRLL